MLLHVCVYRIYIVLGVFRLKNVLLISVTRSMTANFNTNKYPCSTELAVPVHNGSAADIHNGSAADIHNGSAADDAISDSKCDH